MLNYFFRNLKKCSDALVGAAIVPQYLMAHGGGAAAHAEGYPVWLMWTFPPLVTINLCLAGAIYVIGLSRLWKRAGQGSGIMKRQAGAFALGWGILVLALLSPIDALSEDLGWMHMIQHMLLMNVAAPLLVLGAPGITFLWMLPLSLRRKFGGWKKRGWGGRFVPYLLWQPLVLWFLFAFTLWIWHLPTLYQQAMRNELFHDFQHLSFLITACLFWRVLLDPVSRLRMSRMGAVFYLFLTSLHATILGVFMALAPAIWYPIYQDRTLSWNLSALQDQQLAGLIMWMPACASYAVVAAVTLAFWLEKTSTPLVESKRS